MAKGVPFLEERDRNHFLRVEPHEWELTIDLLGAGRNQ
jgi:transketolase